MSVFKKTIYIYLAFLLLAWLFLPFATHAASLTDSIIGAKCTTIDNLISCYAEKIIRLFIAVASIGSIIMIIFGGILLITSAGDSKKVTTGRMAVTGAIIGLVIVLLSFSILQFIEKRTINQNIFFPTTGTNSNSTTNNNGIAPNNSADQSNQTGGENQNQPPEQNVQRVMCVYLGSNQYRQYIYACYENWDKARNKMDALDSFLETRGRLNNPCDPITSEFSASSLISQNPSAYCDDQGDSGACRAAETRGDALFQDICAPLTGDINTPSVNLFPT